MYSKIKFHLHASMIMSHSQQTNAGIDPDKSSMMSSSISRPQTGHRTTNLFIRPPSQIDQRTNDRYCNRSPKVDHLEPLGRMELQHSIQTQRTRTPRNLHTQHLKLSFNPLHNGLHHQRRNGISYHSPTGLLKAAFLK